MRDTSIEGTRFVVLDWLDIDDLVNSLGERVESSFKPNMVIGVHKGGGIIAHLLADRLGVYEFRPVGVRSYAGIERRGKLETYQPLTIESLKEHDVLVVDDVSDTGMSLRHVLETQAKPRQPRSLKCATLHTKSKSKYLPDFYVKRLDAWIVYPWERYETAVEVLSRLVAKYELQEARDMITRDMGLPEKAFERAAERFRGRLG